MATSTKISRHSLVEFAEQNFDSPIFSVNQYPLDSKLFVVENRDNYPIEDYISPGRRDFYKVFHISSGTGTLTVGLHKYEMKSNQIAFVHPDEIMSWQTTSEETGGYFCLIHPDYFEGYPHVAKLFRTYPFFLEDNAVIKLPNNVSVSINTNFSSILLEERGKNKDKKDAIIIHLQMILLEAKRAGKNISNAPVSESYSYIHNFLSLLETNFQIHHKNTVVRLKTASEFAEELHLHPNYLNNLVKAQTGKTLSNHIQERLIYEAKALLIKTNWDISTISYSLGYSNQAAFTSSFKRMERITPSSFRKNMLP
ncbi:MULTISPECIES: AraC family transcriptional regulator [Mesonia]|uniref:Arabinose operon regulatory protein n=1 Tax=Mesonia oceanica TaxID=2687242 RepID=A0AC61YE16_9FLAO|nr:MULTISPECIES: AraC family transcriptional regulator [Mesonia]MAN26013.1 AraC family transcriptional regulator [Mesonia sp.]MAQ41744.1 AraC family transcriptional regulator [Mesonia sp.]MBJ98822.1 AraC family transcriptional regulator [Flavobacteriaceae bacterium]VVV02438.1 Arabinose operon regulatory protein [Mesonia oceanica]|tara:strand:+ start:9472 stop:10404 length:933 start_codon:yes stop_codon:yes gene_type:complete